MVNIRGIANQFMRSRGGAGGVGGAGRRPAGGGVGGVGGGMGRTGGAAGGRRTQDEAIGRGIRKLLGRR